MSSICTKNNPSNNFVYLNRVATLVLNQSMRFKIFNFNLKLIFK